MTTSSALIDERSAVEFRTRFGQLAERSTEIDVAATRVRLSLVDLQSHELGGVRLLRVLLAEVSAFRLTAEAEAVRADPARAANLELLIALLRVGRIEVRCAPLGGWAPDYTVFRRHGAPFAALVGFHSFLRPTPLSGPLFVSEHESPAAALAGRRFEERWARSHDVSLPIRALLDLGEVRPTSMDP